MLGTMIRCTEPGGDDFILAWVFAINILNADWDCRFKGSPIGVVESCPLMSVFSSFLVKLNV